MKVENVETKMKELATLATQGDETAAVTLHSILLAETMTDAMIGTLKKVVNGLGAPRQPVITFGAAVAALIFELECEIVPGLIEELKVLLARFEADPEVTVERVAAKAKIDSRLKIIGDARAAGKSKEEIYALLDKTLEEPTAAIQ